MPLNQKQIDAMKMTASVLAQKNEAKGGSNLHAANVYRRMVRWLSGDSQAFSKDQARALTYLSE